MEAATFTVRPPFGLGPRGPNQPHGAQQAHQGPHQAGSGPSAAPRPEEQHHKPFFYVQPSQSYLPMQSLQWPVPMPMPMSYSPYYGFPGLGKCQISSCISYIRGCNVLKVCLTKLPITFLHTMEGYGLPVMPNYQPNPYMEPPGFVVPHTHLHLMDYRRMLNPQYYQTMAYRRFRYQHNSQNKEMTSSEVQTEPLSTNQKTSTPGSSHAEAPCGLPVCDTETNHRPGDPTSKPLSTALAVPKGNHSLEQKDMVPLSTTKTPSNSSFVIQTEEVRIECCTTPVGLQLLHSHETAEVSHSFLQGHVLQDEGLCLPAEQSEKTLQVCSDVLLVRTPSSSEKSPALEEESNAGSQTAAHGQEIRSEKVLSMASKNLHSKVIQLPFDAKYLDELRKMESTVWSVEGTLMPSSESLIHNDHPESYEEMPAAADEASSADVLMFREAVPTEETEELSPEPQDGVVCPQDDVMTEADISPMMDVPVTEETMMELRNAAEVVDAPYLLLLDNSPLKEGRQENNVHDHQDTSFESLPAYLPSTSWLADFENVHSCSKLPPVPRKQNRPLNGRGLDVPSRRRKLDLENKEQATVRKPKERYKPKGKVVDRRSVSDHECCLSRNFSENVFTPYMSKRDRLCTRCLAKRRFYPSAGPGLDGRNLRRKAVPFQQRNEVFLPTCEACKRHSKKQLMTNGSSPDVHGHHHGHDTEGESSENGPCRTGTKWRSADDPRKLNDLKRPLASKQNVVTCPAAACPKQREMNCVCTESQHQDKQRHCPHGNAVGEMDENCAQQVSLQDKWSTGGQIYLTHRCQTGNRWFCLFQLSSS